MSMQIRSCSEDIRHLYKVMLVFESLTRGIACFIISHCRLPASCGLIFLMKETKELKGSFPKRWDF